MAMPQQQQSPEVVSVRISSPLGTFGTILRAHRHETIGSFMRRVGLRVGLDARNLLLSFNGVPLLDDRTLGSYGICDGSVITYMVRLNPSREEQSLNQLQQVYRANPITRIVHLPPLPRNGRRPTQAEMTAKAKELRRYGIYGLGMIGKNQVALLNRVQVGLFNYVQNNLATSRGLTRQQLDTQVPQSGDDSDQTRLAMMDAALSYFQDQPASELRSADEISVANALLSLTPQ